MADKKRKSFTQTIFEDIIEPGHGVRNFDGDVEANHFAKDGGRTTFEALDKKSREIIKPEKEAPKEGETKIYSDAMTTEQRQQKNRDERDKAVEEHNARASWIESPELKDYLSRKYRYSYGRTGDPSTERDFGDEADYRKSEGEWLSNYETSHGLVKNNNKK